jgi:hypothetical protein
MVVVPMENEVVLEFADTWVETGGRYLTLFGVLGLGAAVILARGRTRLGAAA